MKVSWFVQYTINAFGVVTLYLLAISLLRVDVRRHKAGVYACTADARRGALLRAFTPVKHRDRCFQTRDDDYSFAFDCATGDIVEFEGNERCLGVGVRHPNILGKCSRLPDGTGAMIAFAPRRTCSTRRDVVRPGIYDCDTRQRVSEFSASDDTRCLETKSNAVYRYCHTEPPLFAFSTSGCEQRSDPMHERQCVSATSHAAVLPDVEPADCDPIDPSDTATLRFAARRSDAPRNDLEYLLHGFSALSSRAESIYRSSRLYSLAEARLLLRELTVSSILAKSVGSLFRQSDATLLVRPYIQRETSAMVSPAPPAPTSGAQIIEREYGSSLGDVITCYSGDTVRLTNLPQDAIGRLYFNFTHDPIGAFDSKNTLRLEYDVTNFVCQEGARLSDTQIHPCSGSHADGVVGTNLVHPNVTNQNKLNTRLRFEASVLPHTNETVTSSALSISCEKMTRIVLQNETTTQPALYKTTTIVFASSGRRLSQHGASSFSCDATRVRLDAMRTAECACVPDLHAFSTSLSVDETCLFYIPTDTQNTMLLRYSSHQTLLQNALHVMHGDWSHAPTSSTPITSALFL